jgi:cystathionine beta-lyase/cystathionine gamma-synthase
VLPNVEELRKLAQGTSSAYMYSRYANPTVRAAEEKIAALEGAEDCVVTASGMAATLAAVMAVCSAGDEIVSMLDIYGGTLKLFEQLMPRFGVTTRFVKTSDLAPIDRHLGAKTKLLFVETPTNPTLRCVPLAVLCRAARERGVVTVVDNTFATPILQKPLALGADVALHSATKYLGGHSDISAGAVAANRGLASKMREMMKVCGGNLDPGAAYLLIRGLKTLELRVERACANAIAIAEALNGNGKVKRVMFPGLAAHPDHAVAARQMKGFGMVVSIELQNGAAAERFIDALKLWYLATSLGGVESTVSYPWLSSHAGLSREQLQAMDVNEGTVRLSVGIEAAADLVADLEQALAGC